MVSESFPILDIPTHPVCQYLTSSVMQKGNVPPMVISSSSLNESTKSKQISIESWGNFFGVVEMLYSLMRTKSIVEINEIVKVKHLGWGLAQYKSFMDHCKSMPSWHPLCSIIFSPEQCILRETLNWRAEGWKERKKLLLIELPSAICPSLCLSSFALLWWRHNRFISWGSTLPNSCSILETSSP